LQGTPEGEGALDPVIPNHFSLYLTISYQTKELVLPKFKEDEENGFYFNY
jgi:hypothetical protein